MKIIKELSEMIEEELDGAENYARCALKHKEDSPALSNVFYEISTQEMRHVHMLHDEVVKLIKTHREKHGEPPAAMMAVYEYVHKKHIDKLAEAKRYQELYRNG